MVVGRRVRHLRELGPVLGAGLGARGTGPGSVAEAEGWDAALRRLPYAEWYWNGLALPGSAVAAHHATDHPASSYEDFAADFRLASTSLEADAWADLFARAGAGYVVLTAKHQDGFLLWDTETPNPAHGPAWQADRDLVGEVAGACRRRGMRFGAYYSGGLDWTFGGLGIGSLHALQQATVPEVPTYPAYARSHWLELIEHHRPDVLWSDLGHPGGATRAHELFASYYAAVPEGVVNDRFDMAGVAARTTHADIVTPDHRMLSGTPNRAFEACRALGTSFGWNRAERDGDLLSVAELVEVLVDVRSRGGNLLLAVGPTAHGSIPRAQRERLEGLADWMAVAAEAVIGARPWQLGALPTTDRRVARATTAGGSLYLTLCGDGGSPTVGIAGLGPLPGHEVSLLGHDEPLPRSSEAGALGVTLPPAAPEVPVLRITPTPHLELA